MICIATISLSEYTFCFIVQRYRKEAWIITNLETLNQWLLPAHVKIIADILEVTFSAVAIYHRPIARVL